MKTKTITIAVTAITLLMVCLSAFPTMAFAQAFSHTEGYQAGYNAGKYDATYYWYLPPPGGPTAFDQGLKQGYDIGYTSNGGDIQGGGIPYSGATATTDGYRDGDKAGRAAKQAGSGYAEACPGYPPSPYCQYYKKGYAFGYANA